MSTRTIGFSIYLDGQLVGEQTFDRPVITVGKLSTSTLRVDDLNVSRKHAVIEGLDDGRWRITDLGSTNGTIIRDERITQAFLKDGDRVVLGTTTLVVRLAPAAGLSLAKTATASSGQAASGSSAPAAAARKVAASGELDGLGAQSFLKGAGETAEQAGTGFVLDVALLWGDTILKSQSWSTPAAVTVGGVKADFIVPEGVLAGASDLKLVEPSGTSFLLTREALGLTGDVLRDGKVRGLAELAGESPGGLLLDKPTRARLKLGEFSVLLSYRAALPHTLPSTLKNADKEPALFLLLSAVLHLAFLFISMSIPQELLLQSRDPRIERQKFMQLVRTEMKPEEKEEKKEAKKDDKLKDKRKVDPNAEDKRLEVPQEAVTEDANPNARPSPIVDRLNTRQREDVEEMKKLSPEQRAALAKERAQQTAAASTLRSSSLMSQLMATTDTTARVAFRTLGSYDPTSTSGEFASGALDPFSGTLSQGSSGGFQAEGGPSGPGGPGGPAVAGVLGRQGGDLDNLGLNDRAIEPKIIESAPRLSGELDAKTVQQYIRRQLPGVKWCYQDRLQQNPKLAGKLTLAFTILPSGGVANAQTANSTLGDAELESCIRNKMSRWKFPSPKDGGVVEVAYPLILKSQ